MPDQWEVQSEKPAPPPLAGGDWEVSSETPAPSHWLAATGDVLKQLAGGFGAGATQTITAVSRGLNKIPGIGEKLAPSEGIRVMRIAGTPTTPLEKVGAGVEQGAEMLATGPGKTLGAKIGLGALMGGGSTAVHQAGTEQGVNPADVAINTGIGAAGSTLGAAGKAVFNSKLARGAVNESVMATARDVTYGNPAKALLDNDILTPVTGDLEKFKGAIRNGATLNGAAQAAGGRIAAVNGKINELAPQLNAVLSRSTAKIPASTVTNVIDNGIAAIKANRGITAQDAQTAIAELQAIKDAALKIPGVPGASAKAWAPLEANSLKQEIGQSVNWEGRERVGQLVDPIKKQIYGSLKNAVNTAAPGAKDLNEKLTDLLAAQADVNKLAGFEEVGRGRSMGGVIGPSWMGRLEALAGRFIPAASWLSEKLPAGATKAAVTAITQGGDQQ